MSNFKSKLFVLASLLAPVAAMAEGEPIDTTVLTAAGTTIAGYVAIGAGAGVVIMVALVGLRTIFRAFKMSGK